MTRNMTGLVSEARAGPSHLIDADLEDVLRLIAIEILPQRVRRHAREHDHHLPHLEDRLRVRAPGETAHPDSGEEREEAAETRRPGNRKRMRRYTALGGRVVRKERRPEDVAVGLGAERTLRWQETSHEIEPPDRFLMQVLRVVGDHVVRGHSLAVIHHRERAMLDPEAIHQCASYRRQLLRQQLLVPEGECEQDVRGSFQRYFIAGTTEVADDRGGALLRGQA